MRNLLYAWRLDRQAGASEHRAYETVDQQILHLTRKFFTTSILQGLFVQIKVQAVWSQTRPSR